MIVRATTIDDQITDQDDYHTISATSNGVTIAYSIYLYVLRYAHPNENWNIQALFSNDIKFNFMSGRVLNHQEVSSLISYMFKIQLYHLILTKDCAYELKFLGY
jgi:hypothetical protein